MKALSAGRWVLLSIGLLLSLALQAQTVGTMSAPPPAAPAQRSASDLEKLVQPIALHPDPLIAIILPASVYPVEIVQAARFVKDTNSIPHVDQQPWDENVKAVAKFPALVAKLDADLAWTTQLGLAFLDQRKELMDAIQSLRATAQKAGTLEQKEAVAQYARLALRALGDVENALAAGQTLAERGRLLQRIVTDNQRALDLTQTSYRVGQADLRAVQQQQLGVPSARLTLLRVQGDQLAQRANLQLALGGSFTAPGATDPGGGEMALRTQ